MTEAVLAKLEDRIIHRIHASDDPADWRSGLTFWLLRNPYDLFCANWFISNEKIDPDHRGLAQALIKNTAMNVVILIAVLALCLTLFGMFSHNYGVELVGQIISVLSMILVFPNLVRVWRS